MIKAVKSRGQAAEARITSSSSINTKAQPVDVGISSFSAAPGDVVKQIQRGLPLRRFEMLRSALGMPSEQLAAKVGMSKATFHRRQQEGKLTPDESDKLMRFGRLLVQAISVFESDNAARQWLSSPQRGLGGAVPLDYAETEAGAREVENLLGRMDHGVYS